MAAKKTTKKTTKKTAKTAKTTETSERKIRVPERLVELQKTTIERQRSMFDSAFDAVNSFRERQEDRFNGWLENSRLVPEEIREMSEVWTETSREARQSYKKSVDKTFGLAEEWVDGLASR